jgi:hypothetical protein
VHFLDVYLVHPVVFIIILRSLSCRLSLLLAVWCFTLEFLMVRFDYCVRVTFLVSFVILLAYLFIILMKQIPSFITVLKISYVILSIYHFPIPLWSYFDLLPFIMILFLVLLFPVSIFLLKNDYHLYHDLINQKS